MREAKRKGEERRGEGALSSLQRRHREPLLPSTAFQCKHCHPICDRVNWFFDVSRKVLIEKKKKRNMNLPFSTDSCLSTKKKKILLFPKGFLSTLPKSPLPFSNSHHLVVILYHGFSRGHGSIFFFFEGTNFHLLISQLKKKKCGSAAGSLLPLLIKWNNKGNAC